MSPPSSRCLPALLGVALLATSCQALSGLSDYEVGAGGASSSSTGTTVASTTSAGGAGGAGEGGSGGAACTPAAENCGNGIDEDCDTFDCSASVWATAFGGADFQVPYAVAVLPSGAIAVAGTYADGAMTIGDDTLPLPATGDFGLFYALLDPDGTPIWSLGIGDGAGGLPVVAADDGAVVIAGRFTDALLLGDIPLSAVGDEPFVARVAESGEVEWAVALESAEGASVNALAVRGDEVLVGGNFRTSIQLGETLEIIASGGDGEGGGGTGQGDVDGFVARLEGDSGAGVSAVPVGWTAATTQGITGAGFVQGGDVAIVASFLGGVALGEPHAASAGFAVARLGDDLAATWSRFVQTPDLLDSTLLVHGVAIEGDRIAVTGLVSGTWEHVDASGEPTPLFATSSKTDEDIFVAVWTADGALLWSKQLGDGTDQSWLFERIDVAIDDADGVTLAAGFRGILDVEGAEHASVDGDWLVASWASEGELRWSRSFTAAGGADGATSVGLDPTTGDMIVAGTTSAPLDLVDPPVTTLDDGATTVVVARFAR